MENEQEIDWKTIKIDQLGYVYKDVEKQAKIMEQAFGMPKFNIFPAEKRVLTYRGNGVETTTIIAISRCFGQQIELIQWVDGPSVFKEFLDQGREGLHHVSSFVDNADKYDKYFKELGLELVYTGLVLGRSRVMFYDTVDQLGFMYEIQEHMKSRRRKKKA